VQVTHVFAGIPTGDLVTALAWYERLLGRPPTRRPHDKEAVWQLTDTGLIYVVEDPPRAGRALVTLIVDDLDRWIAELEQRGIEVGQIAQIGPGVRKAVVRDPDGTELGLAQTG
jgi:catechol 2,3-dioxygenase-like lactoylglutathione lyase family enzyme